VSELLRADQLKPAAMAVKDLRLTEAFPDVETRYRKTVVRQLVSRGKWSVAATLAGDDTATQLEVCTTFDAFFVFSV
jgi:hypothetical protein